MKEKTEHCPNCHCDSCREFFEVKSNAEEREEMFNRWNWNLSPAEVAQELDNLRGACAWEDEYEVFEHMSQFWDRSTALAVQDVYENCF